ncbi:MAG: hypothetical protein Q7Q71_01005 [Verrucomicrobiota bacterium JB023]|nr:hypothetical protein [Verrucomicrobiota bacterium JB023]
MDKQEAQFILSSFRPNGSDLGDPAFTEALTLAAQDSELGEWLANERAMDTAFANALAEIPIPENLREDLFTVLAQEPQDFDSIDASIASSLAGLTPPPSLRDEILDAMVVEQKVTALPRKQKPRLPAFSAVGLAAALGIFAALLMTNETPSPQNGGLADSGETPTLPANHGGAIVPVSGGQLSHNDIQYNALQFLSNEFELDRSGANLEGLCEYLAKHQLPIPEELPVGLQRAKGIGCRELKIKDHPATLICFDNGEDSPMVHLVILNRDQVKEKTCRMASAKRYLHQCQVTGWSMASWETDEKIFYLFSDTEPTQLATIF